MSHAILAIITATVWALSVYFAATEELRAATMTFAIVLTSVLWGRT